MQFEFYILDFVQKNIKNDMLTNILKIVTYMGNMGIIWIILACIFILIKSYKKIGLTMLIGLILCLVIGNLIIKPIVARTRPYDLLENKKSVEILITKPTDFSFPSGHTLVAFTSAIIILLYNKKIGIVATIFAILMAFSRIYFYVHFPTDVLAGILLGFIFAYVSKKIYDYFNEKFKRMHKEEL